jgi:hypothetical protein
MISIGFVAFDCKHFVSNGEERVVGAVVGPIRVVEDISHEGETVNLVFSGCSMYLHCCNPNCGYSALAREEARKRRGANEIAPD